MRNHEMIATTSISDFIDTSETIAELLALTISADVSSTMSNPIIAPFQLSDTLSAVVSRIANPAHKKGISVNCIINDPELRSATLLGDKLRIQQLLANVCWNSLSKCLTSSSEDGGRIEISVDRGPCSATTKPGFKRFCFKVADTGIRRRGDEPGPLDDICRKLADPMGGEVRCASVAGKGSRTFSLELDMEIDYANSSSMEPSTPFTSGEFRLIPESQPHPGVTSSSPCCSEAGNAESFYLRTPSSSLETDRAATNAAAPETAADDTDAGHSGSPSNMEPLQQHFEKYMMANPWAARSAQPPYPTGFNQQAPLNLMADATFKVLRETVYDDSAAVLIEMHTPEKVWRQWGSATMVNGDRAAALRAAADDATRRIDVFFQSHNDSRARMPARQVERTQNAPPSTPHFPEPPPSASADVKPSGWPVASPGASLLRTRSLPVAHPGKPKDHERSLTKQIQSAKTSGVSSADPTTVPSLIKILVVDGDLQHLREMQEALECSSTSSKFEVTLAEDGQDVIRLGVAKGIRYDVILLAEKMKHLNGSDTASVYRKYEAINCLPKTLMILTTSNPSQLMDVTFYQSCGIDGIIENKPTLTKNLAKDVMTCFEWRLENGMHRPVGHMLYRTGKLLAEATEGKSSVCMKDTESFESSLIVGDSNLEVFGRRISSDRLVGKNPKQYLDI